MRTLYSYVRAVLAVALVLLGAACVAKFAVPIVVDAICYEVERQEEIGRAASLQIEMRDRRGDYR